MNNDNLERFFLNGLNEQNDSDSGWDMPSDAVWEGIEAALPEDNRHKIIPLFPAFSLTSLRKMKWGAAASVLMLIFAYTAFLSQKKIGNLQQQMALQSNQLQELQENNNTSTFSFPNKETSIAAKVNSFLAQVGKDVLSTSGKSNTLFNDKEKEFFSLNKIALVSNSNNILTSNDNRFISASMKPLDINQKDIDLLPSLKELNEEKLFLVEPIVNKPSKRPQFYAGIFAGPTLWKTTTKNKVSDAVFTKGNKTKEYSVETGFKIGWKINDHWSLESGLSLAQNKRTEGHSAFYQLNLDDETNTSDGTLQSTYKAKMTTGFGNASVAVDVTRIAEEPISTDQTFETTYNNEITTSLVQVPFTARYSVQKGKVNMSLSAGVQLSYLKDQKTEFSQSEGLRNPALLEEQVRLSSGPEMKDLHYAVQAGLQVAYRPTSTVEFYISPNYTKGLTPIAEDEEMTTSLAQMGLMAGVNLYF